MIELIEHPVDERSPSVPPPPADEDLTLEQLLDIFSWCDATL